MPRKWWPCPNMTEKLLTGIMNKAKENLKKIAYSKRPPIQKLAADSLTQH